jgi:hypothetical protein
MTKPPKETLLSVSAVHLIGRLLSDLTVVGKNDPDDKARPGGKGANTFLRNQLRNDAAGFARIFYFSFEGGLFELARPALFLVHGGGIELDWPPPTDPNFGRMARSAGNATLTGLGWQYGTFASDMKVWVYDKGDFSMRLDAESGTLEQILLSTECGNVAAGWSNGVMARSSGSLARSSGVMARSSGALPRRSGDSD